MKKTLSFSVGLSCAAFIFWPWGLAIVEAVRWFFHLAPLHAWDDNRMAMAFIWPFPALLVVLFLLWLFSGLLELF